MKTSKRRYHSRSRSRSLEKRKKSRSESYDKGNKAKRMSKKSISSSSSQSDCKSSSSNSYNKRRQNDKEKSRRKRLRRSYSNSSSTSKRREAKNSKKEKIQVEETKTSNKLELENEITRRIVDRKKNDRKSDKYEKNRIKKNRSRSKSPNFSKNDKIKEKEINKKPLEKKKGELEQENKPNLNSRAGGVYIPPFKLAKIYEDIKNNQDSKSQEYQRMMWEMLRKSINGIINKVNVSNIQNVVYELFCENLIRAKGILARAIIKAQLASPNFTHVYASLVAIINSKLPDIGLLIISRYINQFKKAFKRNNKILCGATTKMVAHLVNQQVVNETLAMEILYLYLENPTDDSVEMACEFLTECGQILSELASGLSQAIFERLRSILHEGEIDRRIQYVIETLFAKRKSGFKENVAVIPELDLVNDEDKIIHEVGLQDELDSQDILDVFQVDKDYEENEKKWNFIKSEILGENVNPNNPEEEQEDEELEAELQKQEENKNEKIYDFNETDLVNLHRTIYLTIISSVDFQECCHKLLKLNMREGQEMELVNMIIECCIEERTYLRFYGLLAERFCKIKDIYKQNFEFQFEHQYVKVHRLETNKLRNLAKLFGHLFYTDAIEWSAFKSVKLTEDETTSSSRIFIKIICQELAEHMGLDKLNERFSDPNQRENYLGMFCRDNPKNTRFCINFFTSIGLGALTEELREFLQNAEKMVEEALRLRQLQANESDSASSSSESSSDSESGSGSSSDGDNDEKSNDGSSDSS